jgi:superfamily II DNA helicase RecQ
VDEGQFLFSALAIHFRWLSYGQLAHIFQVAKNFNVSVVVATATLSPAQRLDAVNVMQTLEFNSFKHLIVGDPVVSNITYNMGNISSEKVCLKKDNDPDLAEQVISGNDSIVKIVHKHRNETGIIFLDSKTKALEILPNNFAIWDTARLLPIIGWTMISKKSRLKPKSFTNKTP